MCSSNSDAYVTIKACMGTFAAALAARSAALFPLVITELSVLCVAHFMILPAEVE